MQFQKGIVTLVSLKINMKAKKKISKKKDGSWDLSDLYRSGKNPFNIEWMKYYNPVEGRDQILFLYSDKKTKQIYKYRILR